MGFRPFVFGLAKRLSIRGFVFNTGQGVLIEAEGTALDQFLLSLRTELPPLAHIDELREELIPPANDSEFVIRSSVPGVHAFALVPPDVATCADCLRDVGDQANRRYHYEFTNCTNCGPRYTIILTVPYDRPATTMAEFPMCAACAAEYRDPANRRFHAQPNACPDCGPQLDVPLQHALEWLSAGEIVAIKGLGGFHLACDATRESAVGALRERKRRSLKPFAVMVADLVAAAEFADLTPAAIPLLSGPERPIVLLDKHRGAALAPSVAPGNRTVGIMLPSTPLHHRLFEDNRFRALVMTSGNLSEEPIVSVDSELPRLSSITTYVLSHNRPIHTRVDDSVTRIFRNKPVLLRRSRGYVPLPIDLGRRHVQVLACGGHLKNTFCLTRGRYALLSQHIGDLDNQETLVFFEETLAKMKAFFGIEPRAVAHDLHPGYMSTRYANNLTGVRRVPVQHHHAHIAACMAEHHLDGDVVGLAMDGTGYGTDGQIWGGEVFTASYLDFQRRMHFRYVPLAGGDAAIREPWRIALSYLLDTYGAGYPGLPALTRIPESHHRLVRQLLSRRVQTVDTSSCGRLFDAVAVLTGVCSLATYEAQPAIELESIADPAGAPYPFDLHEPEIDFRPTIRAIVDDVLARTSVTGISARFHQTVADALIAGARRTAETASLTRVCLSGGSFQNIRLLELTVSGLEASGLKPYYHSAVPSNDGGLSLGQAVIAARRVELSST